MTHASGRVTVLKVSYRSVFLIPPAISIKSIKFSYTKNSENKSFGKVKPFISLLSPKVRLLRGP